MIRIDFSNQSVWLHGRMIDLQPRVFALLAYLFLHPGRIVTKEELLEEVWGDSPASDAAIKTAMSELRRTLGDCPKKPSHIQTLHRRGYRLISTGMAAVEWAPPCHFPAAS